MAVTVIIDLPGKPGSVEEIKSFVRSLVPDTRTFVGCHGVTMHQNQDDPDFLVLQELWESRGHQEMYLAWRTERGDFATIVAMLAGPPLIRYFDDQDLRSDPDGQNVTVTVFEQVEVPVWQRR